MKKTPIERLIRREIKTLTHQKEKLERRLLAMRKALAEIEMSEYQAKGLEAAAFSLAVRSRKIGVNQVIIASILNDSKGPMNVGDIANRVFQTGQIKSPNGQRGVYGIVQTVLRRNRNTTFIKTAPATWDLRERHLKVPERTLQALKATAER